MGSAAEGRESVWAGLVKQQKPPLGERKGKQTGTDVLKQQM